MTRRHGQRSLLAVAITCLLLVTAPAVGTALGTPVAQTEQPEQERNDTSGNITQQSGTDAGAGQNGGSTANRAAAGSTRAAGAPLPSEGTVILDDTLEPARTEVDLDEVRMNQTATIVYFIIEYDGYDGHNPGVFLDVDQDRSTGYSGSSASSISYYIDGIGADYALAPTDSQFGSVYVWDDSNHTWNGNQSLDYNLSYPGSETRVIGIEKSRLGNPGKVDVVVGEATGFSTSDWDYAPNRGNGHVTVDLSSAPVAVSAPSSAGTVQPGGTFRVTYEYTNTGSSKASAGRIELDTPQNVEAVSVSGDGTSGLGGSPQSVLYGFSGPIQPGDTLTTTVTYEVDSSASTGTAQVEVEAFKQGATQTGTASTEVTVSNAVARYDTNNSPGIQPGEAQQALVDLNSGALSPSAAQQIIVALNS